MYPDFYFSGDSLDDSYHFEPSDEHLYVNVSKANKEISYTVERKRNDELVPLCESSTPANTEWSLQLIITPPTHHLTPESLPYSRAVVEAIHQHWGISEVCFHGHLKSGSCSMPFTPKPGNASWKGFMLRTVYSVPFRSVLAVAHNATTRHTTGILFDISAADTTTLLSKLHASRAHAHHPSLTPLLITDMALLRLQTFSMKTYHDFLPVREAMGCNMYFDRRTPPAFAAPDLSDMPRRLTALLNASASNTASLLATRVIVAHLETLLLPSPSSSDTTSWFGAGTSHDASLDFKMRDHLHLMREVIDNIRRRNAYLTESVQAQVQMVYALLAQQDNALNHAYGADMRVIAAVTLCFLPGTFVATLFSASFWDFAPGRQGPVVSGWVWVYCVVTGVLTGVVLGVWRGVFWGVGGKLGARVGKVVRG